MSMQQKADAILTIKGQIKSAIEAKKGSSVTGNFSTYPTEIANLPSGGGGMPAIPSSFTTLDLNEYYTASADGWIKYKVCYYWGNGTLSCLTIGSRVYQITYTSGEEMDYGLLYMEGIAPVYAGESFWIECYSPTVISNSYLKVAYL